MSLHLAPEQQARGKANFDRAVEHYRLTRRDFMKGLLAGGAAVPLSAAAYFGYQKLQGDPVRVGLIGGGDEGGVLVGYHNPDYMEFVAVADLRPSNMKRIFSGEPEPSPRQGFNRIYGEQEARYIRKYDDYKKLLEDPLIEAVVIALPLHLHAPVAMEAMRAGKHVLCEKLMAWNVRQCKEMIQAADETNRILAIGHQRHYSLLYAHAVEVIQSGELGLIKTIRALWHRNNTWPRLDKDGKPMVDDKGQPLLRDGWRPEIPGEDRVVLEGRIRQLGYKSLDELVRWRLFQRTGGGLMAELGSHQLDACSIFLGGVHPLAVSGLGGKFFYHDEREVDDSVFVTFEFPGKNYYADAEHKAVADKNDIVVVTYSSINTNQFEPYGECVLGDRGTMLVESERDVYLFPERNPNRPLDTSKGLAVSVTTAGGNTPAVSASASEPGTLEPAKALATGQAAQGAGPPSRGYREEMEHFAYCVRMHQKARDPDEQRKWQRAVKCHGRVAMADAVIALTSNVAMAEQRRIAYKPEWFDAASPEVPDPNRRQEPILA